MSNEEKKKLPGLLQHKRIGLVACTPMEAAVTNALRQDQATFGQIDAKAVGPGAPELERFHALVLHVIKGDIESDWFRPERLQTIAHPLLLAGEPGAIYSRISLQEYADDTIFAPFFPSELIFRLSRLTTRDGRHAPVRSVKPCVVVADDDRDIIVYLRNVLRNFDVDAHFVSDGRAALAAARQHLPDLLLLDVGMPVMSGFTVLRCLRDDPGTCNLVTMLLTGSSDPTHVENSADLGAVGYILKPFGHLDLIRKLKPFLRNQIAAPE